MIFIYTLNTKDKVRSLSVLLEEIKHENVLHIENRESKIDALKSVCHEIDWHINQSIEFAKTNYLREERIVLLIEHGKRLKKLQSTFEKELIKLGSERDLENEYEINSAFDFELLPKKDHQQLPNSIEIEIRIREALKVLNSDKNNSTKDKAWFKIGLLLATGELKPLFEENNNNATQTALALVDKIGIKKTDRPYISDSIYDRGISKNIYKRLDWMKAIVNHCEKENLIITSEFKTKYKVILDEKA